MARLGYVDKKHGSFGISWFSHDGEGLAMGEYAIAKEPARDSDDWEAWAAERAAKTVPHESRERSGALVWSRTNAALAMKAIKAALKAKRPLYDWEQKALAAGWKPPKGWTGEA